jgi:nucleoid DNA-binding protein
MIISKDELIRNISRDLSDNSTGQISPYDIRHNLLDIIDSVHLLLEGESINVQNFGTFDVRSTRVGENSIANSQIQNAICEDNSAFGYYSLKSNYQGVRNTALGSYSLSCNVHGEDNIGVGYNSLTSNTAGYANVGIGNSTLKRNKFGNFNVAIGHAAGYYVDPATNNKLFIASHPVDNQHICDNPLGSGWTPLIYGDLNNSNLVLGVATRNLVTYGDGGGVLQTKGDITPVENNKHNIGSSNYNWDKIYVANEIVFPSGKMLYSYQDDSINFNKDILPDDNKVHVLGSENNQWASGHFQDLVVTRKAYITDYESISSCIYNCKTLYLASSFVCEENHPCGHLPDSSLNGAGLVLKSLNRDYEFTFVPQNPFYAYPNMGEPDIFGKSYWSSNISLSLSDSCHIKTRRIVGTNSFSAVDQSNGYGVFLKNKNFYFGPETLLTSFLKNTTPTIAGIGDINFLGKFGTRDDFSVTYGAIEPGTNVSQKFLSNIKTKIGNAINGFELKYFDDTVFYNNDRFTISSFNYSETPVNTITLAKYNSDGVFGINNFNNGGGQDILPETIFNARSKSDSVLRSTAETDQYAKSSLQLLGTDNCLNSGIELAYYSSSGNAEFIYYDNFNSESYIQFHKGKKIGLFASSGTMTELLTVGGSGCDKSAVSIHFTDQDTTPNSDIEYGKIFTKEKLINTTQSASLYFMDSSGNVFDLVENKYDVSSGVLYTDENKNTLIGIESNYDRRVLIDFDAIGNTAVGYHALNQLASGNSNVCIGGFAGNEINTGGSNIAIGYGSMSRSAGDVRNNVVIGNTFAASGTNESNLLFIGNNKYPIISGDLKVNQLSSIGANPRRLFIPDDGTIEFQGRDDSDVQYFPPYEIDSTPIESLLVSHDGFELKDVRGNNYPQNELKFTFTAEESADLLILKHSGEPLNKQYVYEFADSGIPYAQLNGDLRILNAIRFSDNTSLYSASDYKDEIERIDVDVVQVSGIVYDDIYGRLQNAQDEIKSANGSSGIFVEGLALNNIGSASFTSPKSGSIRTRSGNNVVIHNRDKNLEIKIRDYVIAIKIDNEYRPIWVSSDRNVVCCK